MTNLEIFADSDTSKQATDKSERLLSDFPPPLMAQLSIDPVSNYYRVAQTLFGRVLLFFAAGWCGLFLGRIALAVETWGELIRPWEVMGGLFGEGLGIIGELLIMAFWPISAALSSVEVSIWLFFFTMTVLAVTFAVFVYSEEPAPAWWLGLVGFAATVHVAGGEDANVVSWVVLLAILMGIGAAFWWALRVFHPELIESFGDLMRGRSSRPGYSSYAKRPQGRSELRKPPKGQEIPMNRPKRYRSEE